MTASLQIVPYGRPAALALRDAIDAAKAGDALAPVTVAVPSNYAGLSMRRALGEGELALAATGRPGIANVRFIVLARVAELLGSPELSAAGRSPFTGPLRAEAVRAALAEAPGIFRDVADHPSTERSLELTFRELREASDGTLNDVARRSPRAADAVHLFRDVRARSTTYYDEHDLAEAAAEAVRRGTSALDDIGHVIVFLPRRLSAAEAALLRALAEAGRLTVIAGVTGDAEADAALDPVRARLDGFVQETSATAGNGAGAIAVERIVAVTDAEEEVRTAIRLLAERLEAGTPLHRVALLYPSAQPYALLAHEQLRAAGIPHNGPSVRTLGQTLAGRTLLGLLRLRQLDFRRDAVADWLSGAPVLATDGGHPAPAFRWDALARAAGVVGGLDQWRRRLERHRAALQSEIAAVDRTQEGQEWLAERAQMDIEHTQRLERFITELARATDARGLRSWPDFAAWARRLLERYLGGEGHRRDWPDDELEAHRLVVERVEALASLDAIRPSTDEATFRRALERELDTPAARIGHFGDGVFAGRISDALGTEFDAVFVLGMNEGLMPPRSRDDPVLPDRERQAAGDDLPLRARRRAEQRRDYLAALAGARERVLLFSRADLRGQRERLPSRWLLEAASALEGTRLYSGGLRELGGRPWYSVVQSFHDALAKDLPRASLQEYDLASLLAWECAGRNVRHHHLVQATPALDAAIEGERARAGRAVTRWDGLVREDGLRSEDEAVSPTALQHWAACPFRYFLHRVLRVAETTRPEDNLTITPLERGNIIHHSLEEFMRRVPARTSPDQPWTADERALLASIGERLCDEAEAAGVTGRPLLWRLDRQRILRDLAGLLSHDEALRRAHGVVPVEPEAAFGMDGNDPVELRLPDGRRVTFRGRIDRIDRAPDGSRLLVIDYKTGKAQYSTPPPNDATKRGTLLQLPIYALAARQRYGGSQVDAHYWFVSEREKYKLAGITLDDVTRARFEEVVGAVLDGVEAGVFPARPGDSTREGGFENCGICPYNRVCPPSRGRVWERKRTAAELAAYVALAEGGE